MWVIYVKMARLQEVMKTRSLTGAEQKELQECLEMNLRKVRKVTALENLSEVASYTEDNDWLMEICRKIDKEIDEIIL